MSEQYFIDPEMFRCDSCGKINTFLFDKIDHKICIECLDKEGYIDGYYGMGILGKVLNVIRPMTLNEKLDRIAKVNGKKILKRNRLHK